MEGKRKYIAIVLFLLIGLTIFTFASNDNELENTKNNLNSNNQQENSNSNGSNIDDSESNSNGGTVNNKVNTNNTIKNSINNINTVNNQNNNINSITDNSYDLALEAVKKLENTYSSTDYVNALALVANVSDKTKKSELEARVSEAKKVIDANSLVSELERIYNSDLTIKDLTNSRNFKTQNNIDNVVDNVSDATIKSNLKARLSVINRVLNDTVGPKVTGVTNNSVVNSDVTLVVSDETKITKAVLLNGKEDNSFADTEVYDVEGEYEITYVDEAFNKTTIKFIIDKTNPVISGVDSTKPTNKNEIVYVSDNNLKIVTIDKKDYTDFTTENNVVKFQKKVTSEGTHTVVAVDAAGNKSETTFVIDKTSPVIESITKSNNDKSTNQDVVVTVKLNENCLTPDGWTKVSDTEFTKVYSNNGKYSVTFSDLAGNTVVAKFEVKRIDKVAPEAEVTTSNNGLPTNQDVVVTLKANEAIYKPTGWTEVTTNKEKEFTKVYSENTTDSVVITDKAGNTSTINFEVKGIDKVSPVIESITKSNNDKSTNQDVVVTVKLNENCLTPDGWTKVSDTEFTKVYSSNGKYSVTFSDLAGNTVVAKFEVKRIDKVAPEAEVTTSNNGLPTNQDVVVTLKANEAIYKPTGWTEVTTNKEKEFTKVYSENTTDSVVITDKAGNTSTINFEVKDIDKVAPEMTSLRMLGTKLYKENGNYVWYVKNNETIYVYVTFAEKLYTNPTITLNNSKLVTAYLAKEDNNSFIYAGAFKLTDGDGLQDGYVSFVVQGYSDEAGNVGVTLTNEDITLDSQKYVIIDRTPVSINLSEGTIGNNFYSKINVKLYDAYGVNKVKVNDTLLPHTGYYVDINDGHAYTFIEGLNTIVAEDKAGNVTTVTYIKDTVAPEVSVKSVVGKDPHYSQISFKLYDNNAIDYFVLNGTKYDRTDAMWSDANYQNIKDSLVDGDNTLVLYDAAGNSTEYNFVLDLVAPTITVKDTSESVNGIYTKISFKLGDDHLIDKFQINESKIVDVTDNNLGDANYHAIKNSLKEGNNTITLYDTAGNSTVFNFKYTSGTVVSNLDTFRNAIANGGVVYLANDISLST